METIIEKNTKKIKDDIEECGFCEVVHFGGSSQLQSDVTEYERDVENFEKIDFLEIQKKVGFELKMKKTRFKIVLMKKNVKKIEPLNDGELEEIKSFFEDSYVFDKNIIAKGSVNYEEYTVNIGNLSPSKESYELYFSFGNKQAERFYFNSFEKLKEKTKKISKELNEIKN